MADNSLDSRNPADIKAFDLQKLRGLALRLLGLAALLAAYFWAEGTESKIDDGPSSLSSPSCLFE